jgi:hypothetical protein
MHAYRGNVNSKAEVIFVLPTQFQFLRGKSLSQVVNTLIPCAGRCFTTTITKL